MNNSIIRFSIFESNSQGHGGEKRTAQVTEILNDSGIKSIMIPTGMDPVDFSKSFLKKFFILTFYFLKVMNITGFRFHPRKLFKTIRLVSQFKGVFDQAKKNNSSVMLWESTRMEFSFVVPLFKEKGFKVVAIPHNIESLVPKLNSGITDKTPPDWFMEEMKMLRKCNYVFAISREETLMLKQFRVNAIYLPYYPGIDTFNYLKNIRDEREKKMKIHSKRKKILMLGSAINTPTKEGIINRINFFNSFEQDSCDLAIAGFGTNILGSLLNKNNKIELLGELTSGQLSDLLIGTDVLLVHQTVTSGALTRIIEMLIAGIPVLANFESGRNYFGTDGLYIYNDDMQLINYLEADNFPMPKIPEKPTYEINVFKEVILNWVN